MPLDDADKKFIAESIASSLKSFGGELDKKFVTADAATKMVEQGTTKAFEALNLDSKLEALGEKLAGAKGKGDDDGSKNKGGKTDPDPAVAKLEEKLEAMEKQNREAQEAREAAEQKAREQRLDGALREHLGTAGVPAQAQGPAIAFLRTLKLEDGKAVVGLNDAGEPTFLQQRKGYVDTRSLADGIKDWVGTDTGKLYLPATGATGTGDGNGGKNTGGGSGNVPRKADGSIDFGGLVRGGLRMGSLAQ